MIPQKIEWKVFCFGEFSTLESLWIRTLKHTIARSMPWTSVGLVLKNEELCWVPSPTERPFRKLTIENSNEISSWLSLVSCWSTALTSKVSTHHQMRHRGSHQWFSQFRVHQIACIGVLFSVLVDQQSLESSEALLAAKVWVIQRPVSCLLLCRNDKHLFRQVPGFPKKIFEIFLIFEKKNH